MVVRKTAKPAGPRPGWRGNLTIGLVSFPVQAFNVVTASSQPGLHLLHRKCHSRIRYTKTCPIHGPVSNDEIVSAFEYQRGQYVEIEPEELEEIRGERRRALAIDAFIAPGDIDPVYFDGRAYYLAPGEPEADEPYRVFRAAMQHKNKCGIGRIIMSGKESLVLVRARDDLLLMEMLHYAEEVRAADAVVSAPSSSKIASKIAARTLQLAESLIAQWTSKDFDFADYKAPSRERLAELVEAKVKGREIVAPQEEEPAEVINLLDALRKSVDKRARSKPARPPRPGIVRTKQSARKSGRKRA